MITELERVALTADLPEYGLQAGDMRMVVHVCAHEAGYEVEFVILNGDLLALAALHPAQIGPIEQDEIAHVRRVQTA